MVLEFKELQKKPPTLKKFYYTYKESTSKEVNHVFTQFPCSCMQVPDKL